MKKTYLVANWKSNKTKTEAKNWLSEIKSKLPQTTGKVEQIILAPYIYLDLLRSTLPQVNVGVQDLSPFPDGPYTGAISARMLQGLAGYALLGHSECRHYFNETDNRVALKVTQALEYNITPIVAISKKNLHSQINKLDLSSLDKIIFMYEPPEAISVQTGPIGVGDAAPLKEVADMIAKIKTLAPKSPVLYGGSIKSRNLLQYLNLDILDGVVPGSASLNADEWLKLVSLTLQNRG